MELKVEDYAPHEIVKFMRENMGITQSELAKKLNRSANWLKAIEQNVNRIYLDDFLKIANLGNLEIIIKSKK